jgi:hypothetical protein
MPQNLDPRIQQVITEGSQATYSASLIGLAVTASGVILQLQGSASKAAFA